MAVCTHILQMMSDNSFCFFRLEALRPDNEDMDKFMSNRESALSRKILHQDYQVLEDKFKSSSKSVNKIEYWNENHIV